MPNIYKHDLTDCEPRKELETLWSLTEATQNIEHLSPYMLRRMIREGKIIPIKLGKRYYVVKDELLKLVFETNRCK